MIGEFLLNVEEWRICHEGQDLNGEECDLVFLFACDKKSDLNNDLRMIEEGLVDRLKTLETSELLGSERE